MTGSNIQWKRAVNGYFEDPTLWKGGVVPGGAERICVCDTAVVCAMARSILTPGWKKILTMDLPLNDCDSMCSISLTPIVSVRSKFETIRSAISCAESPV